ncbi:ABC transporter ATP-binding protein [Dielma fastidiosa]|uniref:ABC-2 type transport system ATP-binding protein n=1 Tax=Dielma fastidiosa TaxID=1034346 RepID=A0A318KQ90_9FIRM|nr:ABC transporter ATP-binding protein [Dielma fastidiosa]PXX78938.1 ABC-2 type transport system ATP-binding protein [Dielma fastidiosa]
MQLELRNLTKQYGAKCAVDDINVVLRPGVYGLLGANGAGKTTLMRMICNVLKPSAGSILLNGKTAAELGESYHAQLGYMPQDFGFYPDFTGREFMYYMAAVKGLNEKEAKHQIEHLLQMVNLQEAANKKIKTYSGGMKQRLGIAQAELNNPAILILDEPTAGLDPKERVRFRNLIANFANEKIVILSTHIVSDVSYIADTILMMKNGKFLLQEPMNTITNCMEGKVWELLAAEHEVTEYNECFSVVNLHHENDTVRLRIVSDTAPSEKAVNVKPSLEDLFLYYFAEEMQNEGSGEL